MGFLSFIRASFRHNAVHLSIEAECSGDDDNDKTVVRPLRVEEALPRLMEKSAGHEVLTPETALSEHAPLLSHPYASYHQQSESPPQTSIQEPDITDAEMMDMEFFVKTWQEHWPLLFVWSILGILHTIKPMTVELKGGVKHCADALSLSTIPGCIVGVYLDSKYSHPDAQRILARRIRSSRFISFIIHFPYITFIFGGNGLAIQLIARVLPAAINCIIPFFVVFYLACYVAYRKVCADMDMAGERRDAIAREDGGELV